MGYYSVPLWLDDNDKQKDELLLRGRGVTCSGVDEGLLDECVALTLTA